MAFAKVAAFLLFVLVATLSVSQTEAGYRRRHYGGYGHGGGGGGGGRGYGHYGYGK